MTLELNKIYNIDCMEGLPKIPTNSVSLILTDPPYGINYQSNYQSARRIEKEERFDKIIGDEKSFTWFLPEVYRVLQEGGSLICFCRWDVQEEFRRAIVEAGFDLRSQVIWDRKVHGLGDLNAQFGPQHDVVWFATKGNFKFKNGRPRSVVSVQRVEPEKMVHPTEKPISLMRYFIKYLTSEGDVVLDPFIGGGATAIASKQLGRSYLGFEIEKEYFEVAQSRLKQSILLNVKIQNEVTTPLSSQH